MSNKLVYVCDGGDCNEKGSGNLFIYLKAHFDEVDPHEEHIKIRRYPCFGGCEHGINITIWPDRVFYSQVTQKDLPDIITHLKDESGIVTRLTGKVRPDVEEFLWQMLDSPY